MELQIALASAGLTFYEPLVFWNILLAGLAGISAALGLWQWVAARRFPLHQRAPATGDLPGVTILKPLKGCDEFTEACLQSWLEQQYPGPVQMLFGVASASDPACELVRSLLARFSAADAALVICPENLGTNAKVSTLIQLRRQAKHGLMVVSDADVLVPPDLLVNAVRPFVAQLRERQDGGSSMGSVAGKDGSTTGGEGRGRGTRTMCSPDTVGLVSCLYRLANPSTLAMRWEAVAINADFWSQVLQSNTLRPMDFGLGAAMLTRREALDSIDGFESLADCLADDYELGNRMARQGYTVALCPVVVDCWDPPQGWGAVWRHQLRWARTIRVCRPWPYFFSILSNATVWPLLWAGILPSPISLATAGALVLLRAILALDLQSRLTRQPSRPSTLWLVPIKDLLGGAIWLAAFLGSTVEWRGQRMRLSRDGTLRAQGA